MTKRHIPFGFLTVAAVYAYWFSLEHILSSVHSSSFEALVDGRAGVPFQYRILVPFLVRMLRPLMGVLPFIEHVNAFRFLFEFGAVFMTLITAFYLAPLFVAGGIRPLTTHRQARWLTTVLFMVALPFHYITAPRIYYYPSDIPSILFILLGLACIHERKWLLYYPTFVLGALNRETICFLTLAHLVVSWKDAKRSRLILHLALQTVLWFAIKIWLLWIFADNAKTGVAYCDTLGVMKNTWAFNVEFFSHANWWRVLLPVYGFLYIPLCALWKSLDRWLKSVVWIVPLFHVAMLIPGEVNELRIYGEMLPIVILALVSGITISSNNTPEGICQPADGSPKPSA